MKAWPDVVARIARGFESSSTPTPEWNEFAKKLKQFIKKELEAQGAVLVDFRKGHFECTGVYQLNGQFAYFSIADVRSPRTDIMFRTLESPDSRQSGPNRWAAMDDKLTSRMLKVWN